MATLLYIFVKSMDVDIRQCEAETGKNGMYGGLVCPMLIIQLARDGKMSHWDSKVGAMPDTLEDVRLCRAHAMRPFSYYVGTVSFI